MHHTPKESSNRGNHVMCGPRQLFTHVTQSKQKQKPRHVTQLGTLSMPLLQPFHKAKTKRDFEVSIQKHV